MKRKPLHKQPLFWPAVAAVVVAGALATADTAHGEEATRVTSGTGWKANTAYNISALDPDQTYLITFASEDAKTKTSKYFETAVKQLAATGLQIFITTTVEAPVSGQCMPKGHINVGLAYRPHNGEGGMSHTNPCYNTSNGSAYSAKITMDSEYKQYGGTWDMTDTVFKNTHTHELGHALGLDHANTDVDGDGTVEKFECVKTSAGNTPVMCSPNGGYTSTTNVGKMGYYDMIGLTTLVNNFGIPQ